MSTEFLKLFGVSSKEEKESIDNFWAVTELHKNKKVKKDKYHRDKVIENYKEFSKSKKNYYHEKFKEEIIKHSVPKNLSFLEAKKQWESLHIGRVEQTTECICTHWIIINEPIRNIYTKEVLIVGSCCIEQFDFDRIELRCIGCSTILTPSNKFVKQLLSRGFKITQKTPIIGHKKCCEWINNRMLSVLECNKYSFKYHCKTFVDYFGGMVRSIYDTPAGIEIAYREDCENYLKMVIGQYL